VFDERSGCQELTTGHVLQVTVTCVLYHVTEKVLHQVFDPYGVNEIYVLQQTTHAKAFVEFQSWHEASTAQGALHGRCIYDFCCLLDIQYAP
jgi:polypyrimidine tract-binding protein 2